MRAEGHDCWEDCDEGPHGCVCGNDCRPPLRFFKPTGRIEELGQIMEGIESTADRLTSNDSMSLDLWLEIREEWFRLHDAEVAAKALAAAADELVPPNVVALFRWSHPAATWLHNRAREIREKVQRE